MALAGLRQNGSNGSTEFWIVVSADLRLRLLLLRGGAPACLLLDPRLLRTTSPSPRFFCVYATEIEMIVYIPESYEDRLRLDRTRHHVIHMNASVLPTYFPYWDRAQAIRTSKQWKQQVGNTFH